MLDKDTLVSALGDEWDRIARLLDSLSELEWERNTPLPGWRVRDVVAHLIGTELLLSGHEVPETDTDVTTLPHVRNEIGARNERFVAHFRPQPVDKVFARFREVTSHRLATLRAMSEEDFHAPSWTPAGEHTYARFMRIRVFDNWMHEQDIRDAVGLPGTEDGPGAEQALNEISSALGFVVGKKAGLPDGSSVSFELGNGRALHVVVEGRAAVVEQPPANPSVRIQLPLGTFTRLCGGRAADHSAITFHGDQQLGKQVLDNLAFVI